MSNDDANAKPTPEFSIVIGLVSTEDADRILETLTELRRQTPARSYEVLIGDRRQDAVSARIRSEFPEALVISAPADTALPVLRTLALERARGETAALRSLANAASMLEDKPALLQLRMLHQLETTSGNTVVLGLSPTAVPLSPAPKSASGDDESGSSSSG